MGEHVHRTTLALRKTSLAAHQLSKHTSDRTAKLADKSVAAVRRDHIVIRLGGLLHTNSNGFLGRLVRRKDKTYLTDRKMAETTN